jgi:serine phosphatase RsbU (regulator of sigma subunit)/rhodanese-related sulfurtransferase
MNQVKTITPAELHDLVEAGQRLRLIDVRSHTEYRERHIPFAENLPVDRIEAGDFTFGGDEMIVVACGSGGGRSERSANLLAENLNRDVHYLDGGTFGWFRQVESRSLAGRSLVAKFTTAGHLPDDSESVKVKKTSLLIMSFPLALAALVLGVIFYYNGLSTTGLILALYGFVSLITIAHFIVAKKFGFFRFCQVLMVLLLPFILQLSLGGFVAAGGVIIWALVSPLAAIAFSEQKQSVYWFGAFVIVVTTGFLSNLFLTGDHNPEPPAAVNVLFLINVLGVSCIIYFMQHYFVRKQAQLKKSVDAQNIEIAEKNKEITDSINYAKRIQFTLLAHDELLSNNLKDHFILFKPKDIVSGDFYWATRKNDKFYLAVCDSTGHGVPGAFMSLLNVSFLNEAISEKGIESPDRICDYVRQRLIESLSHDGSQDGMDGILLCFDTRTRELCYAAANNSPFLVQSNTGSSLQADKMPIGKGSKPGGFHLHRLVLKDSEKLYLFTDGYADQFGGPRGKKFKYKQMQELIVTLSDLPFGEQKNVLDAIITEWQGGLEQTDDILIVGLSV